MDKILSEKYFRPGYELLGTCRVGVPVYQINARLVLSKARDVPLVLEFVLKAIQRGLRYETSIAALLGLPQENVHEAVLTGMHEGFVELSADSSPEVTRLSLSTDGEDALAGGGVVRTELLNHSFFFDGILRKPVWLGFSKTLSPKHAFDIGLPEIPPSRVAQPKIQDIDLKELTKVIRSSKGRDYSKSVVTDVKFIERIARRVLPVDSVVYRGIDGVFGSVLIDGVMEALDLENAIREQDLFAWADVKLESAQYEWDLDPEVIRATEALGIDITEVVKAAREVQAAKDAVETARKAQAAEDEDADGTRMRLREAEERRAAAESRRDRLPARIMGVFDHYPLLIETLRTADQSVTLVTPWITKSVVTPEFVEELRLALERGVEIRIGYGLDEWGKDNSDPECVSMIEELRGDSHKLSIKHLGDSHSKILIVDREFAVIGSFNWLSFRGDPARKKRWETSVKIVDDVFVQEAYEYVSPLFE